MDIQAEKSQGWETVSQAGTRLRLHMSIIARRHRSGQSFEGKN